MNVRWSWWAAACVAAFVVVAPAAQPKQSGKRPSFAGVWHRSESILAPFPSIDPTIYAPKYAAIYAANAKAVADGTLDLGATCAPPGPVRDGELGLFEILDAPAGRITVEYEFMSQIRRFRIGASHPEHIDPSVNGDSVAHWEGDTLVVDTRGVSEFSYMDRNAGPHSDQMHMVERFKLTDADHLKVDRVIEDPITFVKPWRSTLNYDRVPSGELIDYECSENQRNPLNPDGTVGFQLQSTR